MIIFLTTDIISAICARLHIVDIRALMVTCNQIRTRVLPLTETSVIKTIYDSSIYPEIILIETLMYRIGVKISSAYRIDDPVFNLIPRVIPMDYTGMINISYSGLTYYMYARDGCATVYVGWDTSETIDFIHIEQFESMRCIDIIRDMRLRFFCVYMRYSRNDFRARFIDTYTRVCGSNKRALNRFARSPEFIALLRDC